VVSAVSVGLGCCWARVVPASTIQCFVCSSCVAAAAPAASVYFCCTNGVIINVNVFPELVIYMHICTLVHY
jgi:hypothetical protein